MSNLLLILFIALGFAKVSRISEQELDLTKAKLIYMTPGRSTLVDMPCEISHSILGLNQDIKIKIGPDDKNTFVIWISRERSEPTNLTLRCGGEVFVFDIFPNKHTHQDYIRVLDYYSDVYNGSLSVQKTTVKHLKPYIKGDILAEKVEKKVEYDSESKTLISKGEF